MASQIVTIKVERLANGGWKATQKVMDDGLAGAIRNSEGFNNVVAEGAIYQMVARNVPPTLARHLDRHGQRLMDADTYNSDPHNFVRLMDRASITDEMIGEMGSSGAFFNRAEIRAGQSGTVGLILDQEGRWIGVINDDMPLEGFINLKSADKPGQPRFTSPQE